VLRLAEFGSHAFWNDEAWVALTTRVRGLDQFWLSLGVTPPLWAASLQPLALLPAPPEVSLRLLPLGFGMLTIAAAYGLGAAFAGHALGGVLAAGAIATDPLSIVYARELKHYTAEAFFCLVAFWALMRCARTRRVGDLTVLALVLVAAAGFAHTQLFCGPALLGALLLSAAVRREWRFARAVALATIAAGVLQLVYFRIAVVPRLHASLTQYWAGAYVPDDSLVHAARFVWASLGAQLNAAWGLAALPALACLVLAAAARPRRPSSIALVLLVVELAVLSSHGAVPFAEPRVMLFLLTAVQALVAAGVAAVACRLWTRRALRPAVTLAMLAVAAGLARRVSHVAPAHEPEELGPLVTTMERAREPGDGILLYERSGYVYAYYQRRTPRLIGDATMTVGYRPRFDDPALAVVNGATAADVVERALARHPRVWLLGSRFRDDDERRIRDALAARAAPAFEESRTRALLVLAVRR
jgi:hypothetical protein